MSRAEICLFSKKCPVVNAQMLLAAWADGALALDTIWTDLTDLDGRMIDAPVVARAWEVLALATPPGS